MESRAELQLTAVAAGIKAELSRKRRRTADSDADDDQDQAMADELEVSDTIPHRPPTHRTYLFILPFPFSWLILPLFSSCIMFALSFSCLIPSWFHLFVSFHSFHTKSVIIVWPRSRASMWGKGI